MMISVALAATIETAPPFPAWISAALAKVIPFGEFRVETPGKGDPLGHADRKSSGPAGTTVMFSE